MKAKILIVLSTLFFVVGISVGVGHTYNHFLKNTKTEIITEVKTVKQTKVLEYTEATTNHTVEKSIGIVDLPEVVVYGKRIKKQQKVIPTDDEYRLCIRDTMSQLELLHPKQIIMATNTLNPLEVNVVAELNANRIDLMSKLNNEIRELTDHRDELVKATKGPIKKLVELRGSYDSIIEYLDIVIQHKYWLHEQLSGSLNYSGNPTLATQH
jgi:hypothetical protein